VGCESQLGKGTVFHVNLPLLSVDHPLPDAASIEIIPVGSERILFIDDESMLVEMSKNMLQRLGYQVTVRNSSLEALVSFQNQPDAYDLVITDQTMPGMTGIDLARRMLQIRPNLPIILCTGYSSLITEDRAKAAGIKGFALKPLVKKELAVLIHRVLDKPAYS
jgi:CheY-like chemotaxis protein